MEPAGWPAAEIDAQALRHVGLDTETQSPGFQRDMEPPPPADSRCSRPGRDLLLVLRKVVLELNAPRRTPRGN
jgi:hypothetical protein